METKPQKPTQEQRRTSANFIKDARRKTRRIFSSEQKILIVMEALRGEDPVAAIGRKHGTLGTGGLQAEQRIFRSRQETPGGRYDRGSHLE